MVGALDAVIDRVSLQTAAEEGGVFVALSIARACLARVLVELVNAAAETDTAQTAHA